TVTESGERWGWTDIIAAGAVLTCASVFAAYTLGSMQKWRGELQGAHKGAGLARDVDIEKVKSLIRQGRLSGREAAHYKAAQGPSE
ncbi:hypothetical protein ACFL01_04290, partial [Planctomycetota bacterium]